MNRLWQQILGGGMVFFCGVTAPGFGQEILYNFTPTAPSTQVVGGVGIGDVNTDGFDDFALGEDTPVPGSVSIYSGNDGSVLYTINAPAVPANLIGFGGPIFALGDVNGDSIPDMSIGGRRSIFDVSPLLLYVFSGVDGSLVFNNFIAVAANQGVAGDVNGDGAQDLMAWSTFNFPLPGGSVGIADSKTGAILKTIIEFRFGFAWDVSGFGDFDGDGQDDILVSDLFFPDGSGNFVARVVIFSGTDCSELADIRSPANRTGFGESLLHLDDLDQDGTDEFGIGATDPSDGSRRLLVYSGASATLITEYPIEEGELSALGDITGDGVRDFAMTWNAPFNTQTSRVFLYSGKTGAKLFELPINRLQITVSAVGDVNADGVDEFGIHLVRDFRGRRDRVQIRSGKHIWLEAPDDFINPATTLELFLREGDPGIPTVLFITEWNGVPLLQLLGPVLPFDAQGIRRDQFFVPVWMGGNEVVVEAFADFPGVGVVKSLGRRLRFL